MLRVSSIRHGAERGYEGVEKAREKGNVPGVTVRRKSEELAEEMEKEVPIHLGGQEALVPPG